jgi:hypothetical protein
LASSTSRRVFAIPNGRKVPLDGGEDREVELDASHIVDL